MEQNENGKSALAQMNQILADKEALIDKKKKDLADYRQELGVFEAELSQKTKELQEAQEKLRADEEAFRIYKQSEEEKIAERWNEIKVYESNLQKSMEEVLSEKVRLEAQSVELLEKELLEQDEAGLLNEGLNLSALRHAVGIEAEVAQAETGNQEEETEVSESEISSESRDKEQVVQQTHPVTPELFINLQKDVEKQFKSKRPYVIDMTPELLCMKIGSIELRTYNEKPYPKLHLVVNYKNANTDAKLQKKIGLLGRVIPDWRFITESAYFVAEFYIEKPNDTKAIVSKVKECMEKMEL